MADDMVDVAQKRESLQNLIKQEQYLKDEKDLEHLKQSAEAEFAELLELLQQAPNKDIIHSAMCHIYSAKLVTWGVSNIGNDHHYLQTQSLPSNKLNQLFSTKKNTNLERPRLTLSETTRQELEDIKPHVCAR